MRSGPTITEHLPAEELKRLLLDIAAGERDALAELYRHTQTAVYGLALSYLKNFHDAQDLTQDVYVHVWNHAGQYRPVGSAMGWLLTVCRNLCLMRLRQQERQTSLDSEAWDALPAIPCGLTHDEEVLLQQELWSLGRNNLACRLALHLRFEASGNCIASEAATFYRPVKISQISKKNAKLFRRR